MKLTNKFNLPDTFINVIQRPSYSRGNSEISVTEILSPPQLVLLRRRHADDIEIDAADQVWSLFGSAVHNILEHGKDEHHVVEERLFTTFESWRISGAIDLQTFQPDGSVVISDYKVTSAWAVQQEKTEWVDQLNMYACCCWPTDHRHRSGLEPPGSSKQGRLPAGTYRHHRHPTLGLRDP